MHFFFKIGCFTFGGGWSILAQMEQEFVDKRKLITKEELLDMVAVGKSVPGIMITNISMLFGYYGGGWFGGVCAVLGMACPAVLILSFVTAFYKVLKSNVWCYAALRGIRCAVVPIMGSAALSLGKEAFRRKSAIPICALALGALCIYGYQQCGDDRSGSDTGAFYKSGEKDKRRTDGMIYLRLLQRL